MNGEHILEGVKLDPMSNWIQCPEVEYVWKQQVTPDLARCMLKRISPCVLKELSQLPALARWFASMSTANFFERSAIERIAQH